MAETREGCPQRPAQKDLVFRAIDVGALQAQAAKEREREGTRWRHRDAGSDEDEEEEGEFEEELAHVFLQGNSSGVALIGHGMGDSVSALQHRNAAAACSFMMMDVSDPAGSRPTNPIGSELSKSAAESGVSMDEMAAVDEGNGNEVGERTLSRASQRRRSISPIPNAAFLSPRSPTIALWLQNGGSPRASFVSPSPDWFSPRKPNSMRERRRSKEASIERINSFDSLQEAYTAPGAYCSTLEFVSSGSSGMEVEETMEKSSPRSEGLSPLQNDFSNVALDGASYRSNSRMSCEG